MSDTHKYSNEQTATAVRIYFKGINRIQVNRFKAYLLILDNRLEPSWVITDDVKSAQAVVVQNSSSDDKKLKMHVLAGTANLRPKVLKTMVLSEDENQLVRQLNQASKLLRRANNLAPAQEPNAAQKINLCGMLSHNLETICQQLNQSRKNIQFAISRGVFTADSGLFMNKLMIVIDPESPTSINALETLLQNKTNGDFITNELIIAVLCVASGAHESLFDELYEITDLNTHLSLLDLNQEDEIAAFVNYFA